MLVILIVQVTMMGLFAYFVTLVNASEMRKYAAPPTAGGYRSAATSTADFAPDGSRSASCPRSGEAAASRRSRHD